MARRAFFVVVIGVVLFTCGCTKYSVEIYPPAGEQALRVSEDTSKIFVLSIFPMNSRVDDPRHDVARKFSTALEREFLRSDYYSILPQKKIFKLPQGMRWQISEADAAKIGRVLKADAILWGSINSYEKKYEQRLDHYSKKLFDVLILKARVEMKLIRSSDAGVLWRKVYEMKCENRQPSEWMISTYAVLNDFAPEFARAVATDLMPPVRHRSENVPPASEKMPKK